MREGSSIAANGGTSGPTSETKLNPPKSELLEITGVGIDTGLNYLQVQLRQPAGVLQLATSASAATVGGGIITSEDSPRNAPLPVSFFITYERPPARFYTNNHDQALQPTLRWEGWRYEVEYLSPDEIQKIKSQGIPYIIITTAGYRN